MVTFKNMGRLANYLYQFAATYAYAKKHGLEFTVPMVDRDQTWHPIYLKKYRNPNFNPNLSNILIQETRHCYHEIMFRESWKDDHSANIVLEGYWQSYMYFDWCIDEIRGKFGFYYTTTHGVCGLHIRRGDFLQYPDKHILPPPMYYEIAFHLIREKTSIKKVKVFSDDIPWCKENFKDGMYGMTYEFSEGHNELYDFQELMNCEAIVCAASSFSILAATLSVTPNKVVIVPDHTNLFGAVGKHLDTSTMYPKHFYETNY